MKRLFASAILVMLACSMAVIEAGPAKQFAPFKGPQLKVGGSWSITATFNGGERACVVLVGVDESAHLGLYVFDGLGNCVARDDKMDSKVLKDRAVVWHPRKMQAYTIEVRNLGGIPDSFYIDLRR
jgi:hypothetical protein